MSLTDEELRDILARAAELDGEARRGAERKSDVAALIGAAEEVGLSRRAVEQALAERLGVPAAPPAAGALTWARSADGKFHVAEVVSVAGEQARVRFLGGGEHTLGLGELRPCGFIPGERVTCEWPMWGPWTCTVVSYDASRQRLKLSDGWGSTKSFAVADVWLSSRALDPKVTRRRTYAILVGLGAAAGALLGSLLTALLLR